LPVIALDQRALSLEIRLLGIGTATRGNDAHVYHNPDHETLHSPTAP
jgi:hypothetical protein